MKKINFDQSWEYTEASGLLAMFMRLPTQTVNLPHDAMIHKARSAASPGGNHVGYFPGSLASYSKKFTVPEEWKGQSVQLELEGVYMHAEVAVNNQPVMLHPYGYTSFIVDLTPYLMVGKENVVSVTANNTAQPNSRWYSGTGIYRHVWLRVGGQTGTNGRLYIRPWGVFVTTPVVDTGISVVQVQTELAGLDSRDGAVLRSTILDASGTEVAQVETAARVAEVQQTLLVKDAQLWSIDEPYLYTLVSQVLVGDNVIDTETTTFGIRAITIDAQNGLRLNGTPLKLKGGCIHHDNGLLGAAAFDRAEERKIELLKSAGYNSLRSAHNPPSPALLEACDRLGFLVLDETFDSWTMAKTTNDYHLNFEDWWQRDTESMVRRDRNHPSVFLWSIGNEIPEGLGAPAGAAWAQRQADLVRSLDPTRPVTSALLGDIFSAMEGGESGGFNSFFSLPPVPEELEKDRWAMATAPFCQPLDVVGYNYQCNRYAVDGKKFPNRVIAGTETWGDLSYEFWTETARLPHVIGDYIWTAFDYIGEAGFGKKWIDEKPAGMGADYPYHLYGCGDFDICGVKRAQSYYRELLWGQRSAPFIAVFDPQLYGKDIFFTPWAWEPAMDTWTFPGQEGQAVQVHVYSVDDEVELFINGQSQGRKPAGAAVKLKTRFDVTYQPGTIEAVGYKDGKETGRFQIVTTGEPAALRLTPDQSKINANLGSIAYVDITLLDQAGELVKHTAPEVSLEISGAGELLAIGTGDPESEEPYDGSSRKIFQGHLLAVVRSNGQPGEITLTARSAGLPDAQVNLQAA